MPLLIMTRALPATDNKPHRIRAITPSGYKRIYLTTELMRNPDDFKNHRDLHQRAARRLFAELPQQPEASTLISATARYGYAHVFHLRGEDQ